MRVRVLSPGFVPHSSSSSSGVLVQTKLAQSHYSLTLEYHLEWSALLNLMLSPNPSLKFILSCLTQGPGHGGDR